MSCKWNSTSLWSYRVRSYDWFSTFTSSASALWTSWLRTCATKTRTNGLTILSRQEVGTIEEDNRRDTRAAENVSCITLSANKKDKLDAVVEYRATYMFIGSHRKRKRICRVFPKLREFRSACDLFCARFRVDADGRWYSWYTGKPLLKLE